MPAIETEDLTRTYGRGGRSRGIQGLDLVVPEGSVFGFLGPNGAGKTTTIRVLLDFLRPTSGRASVLGLDSRRDSVAIRRRISASDRSRIAARLSMKLSTSLSAITSRIRSLA